MAAQILDDAIGTSPKIDCLPAMGEISKDVTNQTQHKSNLGIEEFTESTQVHADIPVLEDNETHDLVKNKVSEDTFYMQPISVHITLHDQIPNAEDFTDHSFQTNIQEKGNQSCGEHKDNEQCPEKGSVSKPDEPADITEVTGFADFSCIDQKVPSQTVVLFGNSSAVQFGHDNILLGEQHQILENTEMFVPIHVKISEYDVTVINIIGLHEHRVYQDSVNHLICKLMDENEINAFIFVVQLGQLTDTDKIGIDWLQKIFSDRVLPYVIILFTYERDEECDTIVDDLKKNPVLEWLMKKCGERYKICSKIMNKLSEMQELMDRIKFLFFENNLQTYTSEMYNTELRERVDQQESETGEKTSFINQFLETEKKKNNAAETQPLINFVKSDEKEIQMDNEGNLKERKHLDKLLVASFNTADESTINKERMEHITGTGDRHKDNEDNQKEDSKSEVNEKENKGNSAADKQSDHTDTVETSNQTVSLGEKESKHLDKPLVASFSTGDETTINKERMEHMTGDRHKDNEDNQKEDSKSEVNEKENKGNSAADKQSDHTDTVETSNQTVSPGEKESKHLDKPLVASFSTGDETTINKERMEHMTGDRHKDNEDNQKEDSKSEVNEKENKGNSAADKQSDHTDTVETSNQTVSPGEKESKHLDKPLVASFSTGDETTINKERMEHITMTWTEDRHKVVFKVLSINTKNVDHHKGKEIKEKVELLFQRLNLKGKHDNKIRTADVLQLTAHSLESSESCAEKELVQTFLQKLLMMNYRARYIKSNEKTNNLIHTKQDPNDSYEYQTDADIFKEMSLSNKVSSQSDLIHPMDVQMAVFHCADSFLKQLMVTKLAQCQYALPLLVPDPFTQQIEFPLWTYRQIKKSWKMKNIKNEIISKSEPVYKVKTPMVAFFRFGSVSSSKSQLMNSLINEKHNTFFHRNCPGSSRTRILMDGVVEIAWYCPSGKDTDKFNDCVAFCNLHGEAGTNEKQLQILTEMATVNVVIVPFLDRNEKKMIKVLNLYKDRKPLICLFTEDVSSVIETRKGKYKIGLKDRNQSDVSEDLRRAINGCLKISSSDLTSLIRLEDLLKNHTDIRVDEENDKDCKRGKEAAQQMVNSLKNKNLTEIKRSLLPCQGELWHQWSEKNKELHRPQGHEPETEISEKQTELKTIRQQQHKSPISEFIKIFIKEIHSDAAHKISFLKWLGILLDEHTSSKLSALHYKYDEKWSEVLKLKENHDKSEKPIQTNLTEKQAELDMISKQLQAATFGLEHILREIGQIYESCSTVTKNREDLQFNYFSLPRLAAEMMLSGFPLELMDGDAAHVPLIWITAVLDELIKILEDQRVFVLSVLGIQSSGKSTMLNAMFGLQFAVSAGRCTRGAFMQLLKVSDEMKAKLKFDYILVVDTEGLRALELAGRSTRHHDNELATFVVGIGNLTLINIFGENTSEMQDILQIVVQAFMRMKKVRLNPSCTFVHQNVSDVTAGEKNMEGRRRLQETLDEMTKLAAAEEEVCDVECLGDVITFNVQDDVKYFAQLWEGSPPMAPPNPNYSDSVQELKKHVLCHVSKSDGVTLKTLKDRIKDLWTALLDERFVFSFKNSLEIAAYRKLETEYSKWTWTLRSAMLETESKLYNLIENEAIHEVVEIGLLEDVKKTNERVNQSMSDFFEKDTYADIMVQWKISFEIKIKELQKNLVRETESNLREVLQQRELKKKIDFEKTHRENTLFEKSKELAMKLKDKANDKETLKEEFDSFWKQWMAELVRDAPPIKDIDIIKDVKKLLCEMYEGLPVDHWKESSERNDFFTSLTYSKYVNIKKSKNPYKFVTRTVKCLLGLNQKHKDQINDLIKEIEKQTEKMIKMKPIARMGYNITYIQELIDQIKRKAKQHEEGPVDYIFKNEFIIDLTFEICKRANKTFTDQHRIFKDTNDPLIYVGKKRNEYYRIFQKYLHGATSATILGDIICQKLKEPVKKSVYKNTARDLANEMRTNCHSLNGNRSNLEKHILKTLAEDHSFEKCKTYITNPREHFKDFIRDEVSQYITDNFIVSVLPKMKNNITHLQQKITEAAKKSTEYVKDNSGDADMWLKVFAQDLSGVLLFSVKDFSGVNHDDVDDFKLLEVVIREEIPCIMSDLTSTFSTNTFPVNLDCNDRPDEILIDYFCQCCWVQCPFCGAICTNTIENHDEDHSVPFHRVPGIRGMYIRDTNNLTTTICTSAVASSHLRFYPNTSEDTAFFWKEYRTAGPNFAKWSITPDLSELPYWKWFLCTFQTDLENHHSKTFQGGGEIPSEWKTILKQEAIESLDKYF